MKKLHLWLMVLAIPVLAAVAFLLITKPTSAAPRNVLLLYGWHGTVDNWSTAKAAYEAEGINAYALALPRNGDKAGDTKVNADFVQSFIRDNNLSNVQVDGHSLGGWISLYLILVRRDPAITSGVLRDTGTGCYFGIPPDQCSGSQLLQEIQSASPSNVPVLNLSSKSTQLPGVSCTRVFNLSHNAFLTDSNVNNAAVHWPSVNPCSSSTTPTLTTTPTSVPATPTPTVAPTLTPTPTSVPATPTPTSSLTPTPTTKCSWFSYWRGLCH